MRQPMTMTTIPSPPGMELAEWIDHEFLSTPIIAWLVCTEEFDPRGPDILSDIDRRDIEARSFPVTPSGWFDGKYEDSPWYIVDAKGYYSTMNGAHIGNEEAAEEHAKDWAARIAAQDEIGAAKARNAARKTAAQKAAAQKAA